MKLRYSLSMSLFLSLVGVATAPTANATQSGQQSANNIPLVVQLDDQLATVSGTEPELQPFVPNRVLKNIDVAPTSPIGGEAMVDAEGAAAGTMLIPSAAPNATWLRKISQFRLPQQQSDSSFGAAAPVLEPASIHPMTIEPMAIEPMAIEPPTIAPAFQPAEVTHMAALPTRVAVLSSAAEPALALDPVPDNCPRMRKMFSFSTIDKLNIAGVAAAADKQPAGPAEAELQVTTLGPNQARANEAVRFVVSVRNSGAATAEAVRLKARVNADARILSSQPTGNTESPRTAEIWIGRIAPGQLVSVQVDAMNYSDGVPSLACEVTTDQ